MAKSNKNKASNGRALGTEAFLALVKRKAGPMTTNKHKTRSEQKRAALREQE